jgi:hypothetical protein
MPSSWPHSSKCKSPDHVIIALPAFTKWECLHFRNTRNIFTFFLSLETKLKNEAELEAIVFAKLPLDGFSSTNHRPPTHSVTAPYYCRLYKPLYRQAATFSKQRKHKNLSRKAINQHYASRRKAIEAERERTPFEDHETIRRLATNEPSFATH